MSHRCQNRRGAGGGAVAGGRHGADRLHHRPCPRLVGRRRPRRDRPRRRRGFREGGRGCHQRAGSVSCRRGLTAGPYRLEAALDGFAPAVRRLVLDAGQTSALDVTLTPSQITEGVIVTARRIEEAAQEVPISVSVVSGDLIESVGAFNVNRVKDLIPTVQFYSTNPRNSAINIRGSAPPSASPMTASSQASVFTLTASSTLVPRRRRSTSSTSNRSRSCADRRERSLARTRPPAPSTSRPAGPELHPRLISSSTTATWTSSAREVDRDRCCRSWPAACRSPATQRDGTVLNTTTQSKVNEIDNLGARGQLLFAPSTSSRSPRRWITRASGRRVSRRSSPALRHTPRPANRQYPTSPRTLGYTPPSFNAFDRLPTSIRPAIHTRTSAAPSLTLELAIRSGAG